jgi:hypothetical protein
VTGAGTIPASSKLWVVEQVSDGDFYFLGTAGPTSPGEWATKRVPIGGPSDGEGSTHPVMLILIDDETSNFVSELRVRDQAWGPTLPKHVQVLEEPFTRRVDRKDNC